MLIGIVSTVGQSYIDNRTLFGLCSGHGLQAWYGTIFKYSYSIYQSAVDKANWPTTERIDRLATYKGSIRTYILFVNYSY